MSKYDVQYKSSSKGLIDIESMPNPHLVNAWRKLGGHVGHDSVAGCMAKELESRGCIYDADIDLWSFPDKDEP